MIAMDSSSAFVVPADFSAEWRDITLAHQRTHTLVYTATRYGRRFLLKAQTPDCADLTDYRLQQEREFQLGIQLVHPNIAATYGIEKIEGVGRCIVQEWIDGTTLGEWLQTKPSKSARRRVFSQVLDALDYLHGLQLVHHDLKADNILVTRNGANAKLIDFGLSATDATLSPVSNDLRQDIEALRRLFPSFVPKGRYANIAALRRALHTRQRMIRILPVILSIVLLLTAAALFYLSWHRRHVGQERYEEMVAIVNRYIASEKEQYEEMASRPIVFHRDNIEDVLAWQNYINEFTDMRHKQWVIRDSLMKTYDEGDLLREQVFQIWIRKETELDDEYYALLLQKLQ